MFCSGIKPKPGRSEIIGVQSYAESPNAQIREGRRYTKDMADIFNTLRPPVRGVTHMVATGHYLASAAGYRILEEGGNAIDAGIAAGM